MEEMGFFTKKYQIYCSYVPLGGGNVKIAHGTLSVPAPATVKIIENSALIFQGGPIDSELVTPTGAALLVKLNPFPLNYLPKMKIEKIGNGCGQKKFHNFPNILRLFKGHLMEGDSQHQEESPLKDYIEQVAVIETDVDDISGELIGNFMRVMEKEDILDIQVIPALTKKNRTSQLIKILCHPAQKFKIMEKVIEELGTLGVRFHTIERVCVDRKTIRKLSYLLIS